jgi:hypothetical protein
VHNPPQSHRRATAHCANARETTTSLLNSVFKTLRSPDNAKNISQTHKNTTQFLACLSPGPHRCLHTRLSFRWTQDYEGSSHEQRRPTASQTLSLVPQR